VLISDQIGLKGGCVCVCVCKDAKTFTDGVSTASSRANHANMGPW